MPDQATIDRLLATYQRRAEAIRGRTTTLVAGAWNRLDDWRDPSIERFAATVAPIVEGGQQATAAFTVAYIAAATDTDAAASPVDVTELTGPAVRGGTPTKDVYRRSGREVWNAVAGGVALETAVRRGLDRAVKNVATDLQLAKTHASRAAFGRAPGRQRFLRVPQGPVTCALCLIASTQTYRSGDLMPIHPGCDCDVRPAGGNTSLDLDRLSGIHEAVRRDFGDWDPRGRRLDYRKVLVADDGSTIGLQDYQRLVTTREHGELGPVLTASFHDFTGPIR